MAAPLILAGIGAALGYAQGQNAISMSRYNQRIAQANADLIRAQSERVMKKADADASLFRLQGRKIVGQQRSIAAGANVDVNTGNIADIQAETELQALNQARNVRNNAFLDALGLETQALNYEFKGRAEVAAAESNSKFSIITGALQGFSSGGGFQGFGKMGGGPTVPEAPVDTGSNMSSSNYNLGGDYNLGGQYFSQAKPEPTKLYSLGSERYVW